MRRGARASLRVRRSACLRMPACLLDLLWLLAPLPV